MQNSYVKPLKDLVYQDPDFLLQLSVGFQLHIESPVPTSFGKRFEPDDSSSNSNSNEGGGNESGGTNKNEYKGLTMVGGMTAGNATATLAGGLTLMGTQTRLGGVGVGGMGMGAAGNTGSSSGRNAAGTGTGHIEIPPAVQCGIDLLKRLQKMMPGLIAAYVEMARFLVSIGMHEEVFLIKSI